MATEFEFEPNCGVYKITSPAGKVYVGSSINLKRRLKRYEVLDCKAQPRLHNSLSKYGYEAHKIEILEYCSSEFLWEREIYWGAVFDVLSKKGLNCALPKSTIYPTFSEERRQKLSKLHKGRKLSLEAREKIRKANLGLKKGPYPKQHRDNISKGHANSTVFHKIVLDLETGIYYRSCVEAASVLGCTKSYLSKRLTGKVVNKTNLIYC